MHAVDDDAKVVAEERDLFEDRGHGGLPSGGLAREGIALPSGSTDRRAHHGEASDALSSRVYLLRQRPCGIIALSSRARLSLVGYHLPTLRARDRWKCSRLHAFR